MWYGMDKLNELINAEMEQYIGCPQTCKTLEGTSISDTEYKHHCAVCFPTDKDRQRVQLNEKNKVLSKKINSEQKFRIRQIILKIGDFITKRQRDRG